MPSLTRQGWSAANVAGELVYAVGDIHGRYDLLLDLLSQVNADIAKLKPARRPVLIFCGDYIDRGPDSAKVVEALVWLSGRPDLDVRCLVGNHEQALLNFLADPDEGADWLKFGGRQTLISYGIDNPRSRTSLRRVRDAVARAVPPAHLRFLEELAPMVQLGDYAFVHAGVRPGVALDRQSSADLLWIRADFLGDSGPFDKVIVHGHTWIDTQPRLLQHRIGLDTGAYATGVLTAVRIQDGDLLIIQARDKATSPAMPAPLQYTDLIADLPARRREA